MKYLHEVGAGPCDMKSGYGLLMAEQSGFPRAVLQDARHLRAAVRDRFPVLVQGGGAGAGAAGGGAGSVSGSESAMGAVTTLLQHLLLVQNHASMEDKALRQYLQGLRERVPDRAAEEMLQWLDSMSVGSAKTLRTPAPSPAPLTAESVIVTPHRDTTSTSGDHTTGGGGNRGRERDGGGQPAPKSARTELTSSASHTSQLNLDEFI